jgi:hypothetical protein
MGGTWQLDVWSSINRVKRKPFVKKYIPRTWVVLLLSATNAFPFHREQDKPKPEEQ